MNRKQITFFLLLFLLCANIARAQPATKADIQVLEAKITSIETTVREMDKRFTNQEAKITNIETTVREMDKRLTNQIEELDKRLTAQIQAVQTTVAEMGKRLSFQTKVLFWAIGTLIGVVLAVIALPQLLGYFQEKRARADFQEELNELKQRLERQQKEIEELKSQRVVMPS